MQELIKLLLGCLFLLAGYPIGNYLVKITKEELKDWQKWFKLIILVCMIGTVVSLIIRNDALLFSFLFIIIVTSRSLRKKRK